MGGFAIARCHLGNIEKNVGNMDRAAKHHMIATGCGRENSLKAIKEFYSIGHVTRDEYSKALKAFQTYLGEIKSDQRDAAAAYDEEFKYY